ncbi:ATP-binding protein [Vibrio pectenicida]|uniref:ATP-binding protein n=1 Tax=Vibrio pectenicida TaxID=62763 RepID=A0A7Y3ZYH6_9VIBR|nr:AAA family ATPase [Vibrio pectenicida]NOH71191.1 ATP-binding protein [Vibrio pectenicida]
MINDNVISYKNSKLDSSMNIGLGHKEATNASLLSAYAHWCETLIQTRLQLYFGQDCPYSCVCDISPPDLVNQEGTLAKFVASHQLDFDAQLLLALALMPTVKPQVLDMLMMRSDNIERPYTEFGGAELNGAAVANGETLAFLLGGECIATRLKVQRWLSHSLSGDVNSLSQGQAAVAAQLEQPEFALTNPLKLPLVFNANHNALLTLGTAAKVAKGAGFPAQLVESPQSLESLVLPDSILHQLNDIQAWSQHGETLRHEWGMANRIRPGYRALFYGPSGTGKTMTAGVLGQRLGKDVYKVDLSQVHSKYIGETEKNLERVFTLAEQNGWVLFFDEADAVFGKRTQTSNSNDQFANQNVSYLLQRIECFTGLVILASNYKDNVDEAFVRRFESVIEFPKPESQQRLAIWQKGLSPKAELAPDVDLKEVALKYPLSGASIMNVIRYVSLKAISESRSSITLSDLHEGIDKETRTSTQPRW